MKKRVLITIFSLCLLLASCGSGAPNTGRVNNENKSVQKEEDVIEIKEKMFIAQCNDIYLNPKEYKGKTIKLEGFYDEATDAVTKEKFHFIIRNGPGCCGNDGVAGFQFTYNGSGKIPKLNDWIEVVGTVELADDNDYVTLKAKTVNVLKVRGKDTVLE